MSEAETTTESTTLAERTHTVMEGLRQEGLSESGASEPAAGGTETSQAPNTEEQQSADTAADSDAPTDEREARRARLEELRARERQAAEQRQREQAERQRETELETLRRELAEARQRQSVDLSSPEQFFQVAAESGIDPAALGDWLRSQTEDPSTVARKTVSTELAQLREQLREEIRGELLGEIRQRESALQYQQQEQAALQKLQGVLSESTKHPLAAAFLEHKGADRFYQQALSASENLPAGAGLDVLLDAIEEHLEADTPIYSKRLQAPAKDGAAAKANTVSNRHASGRTEIVEEPEWADLPFDERVARLSGR